MKNLSQEENFNTVRYKEDFKAKKTDISRIDVFLKMLGKNKRILDLGCWDGYTGALLKKKGNKVIGVDVVDVSLEKAEKVLDTVYKRNFTEDWVKGIGNNYDAVLAGEVIEHIYDTDKFLESIKQLLKPNGELIISTPNIASLGRRVMLALGKPPNVEYTARWSDSGHIRYFTVSTLRRLLTEHNFEILEVTGNVVNFSSSGILSSKWLAHKIPTLATSIIIKCRRL